MSTLTIPDVAIDLADRLRERAAFHGRTVEDEARAILADALGEASRPVPANLADAIRAIMIPIGGVDLPSYRDAPAAPPIRFD